MNVPLKPCPACKREQFYVAQGFDLANVIVLGHTCEAKHG